LLLWQSWRCSRVAQAWQRDANTTFTGFVGLDRETCAEDKSGADCIMNLQISGDAALMYKKIPDKAVYDECTEDMVKSNTAGLNCHKTEGDNDDCDFGYHFGEKTFGVSGVSC
jgi:hypothetical protein